MPDYRFYSLRRDGHIAKPAVEKDCPDDEAALQEARSLMDGRDMEIWQGSRRVGYLTADNGKRSWRLRTTRGH